MKYILNRYQVINEEDAFPVPDSMGLDAPAQAKKEEPIEFIFMNQEPKDEEYPKKKYPDGSIEIEYPNYKIKLSDIKTWAESNIVSTSKHKLSDSEIELRIKNLLDIVSGKKSNIAPEDITFIEKLKNALDNDILRSISKKTIIHFSTNGKPLTNDINITFIKYKK
jgi:hypothetical protein